MPRVTRERVSRERVERLIQTADELLQRQCGGSGRSQLERQRKSLQLADDGPHTAEVELGRWVRRPGS